MGPLHPLQHLNYAHVQIQEEQRARDLHLQLSSLSGHINLTQHTQLLKSITTQIASLRDVELEPGESEAMQLLNNAFFEKCRQALCALCEEGENQEEIDEWKAFFRGFVFRMQGDEDAQVLVNSYLEPFSPNLEQETTTAHFQNLRGFLVDRFQIIQ